MNTRPVLTALICGRVDVIRPTRGTIRNMTSRIVPFEEIIDILLEITMSRATKIIKGIDWNNRPWTNLEQLLPKLQQRHSRSRSRLVPAALLVCGRMSFELSDQLSFKLSAQVRRAQSRRGEKMRYKGIFQALVLTAW